MPHLYLFCKSGFGCSPRKALLWCLFIWCSQSASAQFDIQAPIVNSGVYAITDTVYLDPNGNDSNPGTFDLPLKSFNKAVDLLPFGTAGINGGNAYGLIMFKPGHYPAPDGFHQRPNRWQNGNTFKNISVEGIGHVSIGGTRDALAGTHVFILSGNHIFIKNIHFVYSEGIGILLSRSENGSAHQHNILIEDVTVDSVGNFSMLIRNADKVLVRNSKSLYAARPGYDGVASPCQWPSGIKFFNCTDVTIHDCEIAYTRGEGLNFHNSNRGEAYRNIIHDNGLNVYNDNSARLSIHHNLIYNTPDIGPGYWRNCPADTQAVWAGAGFLIANEGACGDGNLPIFENCRVKCILPDETFLTVDSMYVFNNIIQNVGEAFGFWQGRVDITGVNCIRNVFIFNNTIIGVMGMEGVISSALVHLFFPNYNFLFNSNYSYLENVRISQNIFTYDTAAYPQMKPYHANFHDLHPGPRDITFHENVWVKSFAGMSSTDIVRNDLPGSTYLLSDSVASILPCMDNPAFVMNGMAHHLLKTDYLFKARNAPLSNVGALEYDADCVSTGTIFNFQEEYDNIRVYPNPARNGHLSVENLPANTAFEVALYSVQGVQIYRGIIQNGQVSDLPENLSGLYLLEIRNETFGVVKKIMFMP